MGNKINTKYDDYWPMLTADEQIIYTTKMIPVDMRFPLSEKNRQEDFFFNKKLNNGQWGPLYHIGKPINTKLNEGAPSISADGQWFYFTACQRPGGKGRCDIYKTRKTGDSWLTPVNLGPPINTSAWESQPSVTADGRTLYFTSDRPGTIGNLDIWVSHLKQDGTWSKPENLGPVINTKEKEMSPFIHPDGKTLYFVSNGHPGFGNQDIFISRKNNDGSWQKPVNLGWPINSQNEERGVFVNARGNLALISAARDGNQDIDIYSFELYPKIQPTPSTYVTGIIRDAETKKTLEAELQLVNIETGDTIAENISDSKTGKYLVVLPTKNTYAFNVSKKGYLFYSENFNLTGNYDINKPFVKNIDLQAIKPGKKVVLKNIFFELDSYELKPESKIELNKLIEFLNLNPTVKIELAGHTDNQGSRLHNITLSQNRAKAVYNYLTQKGIKASRLQYKGYGQDQPIADNSTKKGRALNRRTEFKVIAIQKP
jgi:outer membrane protein OmpA-like peptidoglycan-associated protein